MKYDLCLYQCSEKIENSYGVCKENCFNNSIIPYRHTNHMAREDEENLYKKCLSEKFPNIQKIDFWTCSKKLQKDRIQILSQFMEKSTESILQELH